MSVAAVPQASADNLKHKKHAVHHHLTVVRSGLDESSARLRHATAALDAARSRLSAAQTHLAHTRGQLAAAAALDRQMQAKLDAAVQRLQRAQAAVAQGQEKITGQRRELGRIVVSNYQTGDPALMGLSMVLTSQDPTQLTGQLNSMQNVLDKESVVLDHLEASKVLLTVQEKQVRAAKVEVARQRQAAAANLQRKQALEQQAEDAAAQVRDLVHARAQARHQAAQARAADRRELDKLQRQEDRISAMLRKRAEAARRRAAAAAARKRAEAARHQRVSRSGSRLAPSDGGYLSWPVVGPVTSPFGWRVHPIYGYRELHDGIDIAAGCGVPIHAPADGTVLQEYYQTAWGNRLVMDFGLVNGVGLAAIVNHLSGYAVRPGQHFTRGQVIGYIGTTGWSTGCHTHFTVLADGTPVNPMNWL